MTLKNLVNILLLGIMFLLSACGGGGESSGADATITAQPVDQSVVEGSTATFNVAASNAIGYQWQLSTDGGVSFADVTGATASSYTTPVTVLADSGLQYRVVVSGTGSNITSSAATLTVTVDVVAPGITVQPADQTVIEGQNVSFSVTATGTSLSYQWQLSVNSGANFADITGETNASLTLTTVPLGNNGYQYRVVVSNTAGTVNSNAATLTVNPQQVQLTAMSNGSGTGTVVSTPAGINCGATCSANFDSGASVTLSATPSASSDFVGWSGGGCSGTGSCVVSLSSAATVTATFNVKQISLTVTRSGTGTGTVTSSPAGIACGSTCSATYPYGTVVTLSAVPDAVSTFAGWSGRGCTGTGTCVVTVDSSATVNAAFQ